MSGCQVPLAANPGLCQLPGNASLSSDIYPSFTRAFPSSGHLGDVSLSDTPSAAAGRGLRGKLRKWAPCGDRRQGAGGPRCYRPGHGHLPVPGASSGKRPLRRALWDQHLGSTRAAARSQLCGAQHPGTPAKLMGLPQRHPPRDPSYSAGAARARSCAPAWHACPPFCFLLAYMPPRKPVSLFQVTLGVSGEEGTACAPPAPSGKARGLWA